METKSPSFRVATGVHDEPLYLLRSEREPSRCLRPSAQALRRTLSVPSHVIASRACVLPPPQLPLGVHREVAPVDDVPGSHVPHLPPDAAGERS